MYVARKPRLRLSSPKAMSWIAALILSSLCSSLLAAEALSQAVLASLKACSAYCVNVVMARSSRASEFLLHATRLRHC
jgi:hypothetical protein